MTSVFILILMMSSIVVAILANILHNSSNKKYDKYLDETYPVERVYKPTFNKTKFTV